MKGVRRAGHELLVRELHWVGVESFEGDQDRVLHHCSWVLRPSIATSDDPGPAGTSQDRGRYGSERIATTAFLLLDLPHRRAAARHV